MIGIHCQLIVCILVVLQQEWTIELSRISLVLSNLLQTAHLCIWFSDSVNLDNNAEAW